MFFLDTNENFAFSNIFQRLGWQEWDVTLLVVACILIAMDRVVTCIVRFEQSFQYLPF